MRSLEGVLTKHPGFGPHVDLCLSDVEWAGLRAKCAEFGVSPEQLLLQFVRDLTGAPGNCGSNERDNAEQWAALSLRIVGRPPATERARNRSERLRDQYHRLLRTAQVPAAAGLRG